MVNTNVSGQSACRLRLAPASRGGSLRVELLREGLQLTVVGADPGGEGGDHLKDRLECRGELFRQAPSGSIVQARRRALR
jgi:hypothetical protein